MKSIEAQGKNGAALTRQLLKFTQGGKYKVKPTDLNALLDRSTTMFGHMNREIVMHKKFASELRTVEVDQGQLERVFLDLFVNTWQAMPGGHLYLAMANVLLDEIYTRHHNCGSGQFVRITIADTGGGVDAKTSERIFEPFFTRRRWDGAPDWVWRLYMGSSSPTAGSSPQTANRDRAQSLIYTFLCPRRRYKNSRQKSKQKRSRREVGPYSSWMIRT